MLDINKVVQETIENMNHEGKIQELIERKVSDTIESIMADSFKEYSDFGRNLKKYVNDSLNIDFNRIGLEGYHDHIIKIISKVISTNLHGESENKLKETLSSIISEAPKQMKLSEIVSMMKEQFTENASEGDNRWDNMTCRVDDRNDRFFCYIGLDKEPGKSSHGCEFRIGLHRSSDDKSKWEVFTMRIDGDEMKNNLFVGPFYNVEKLLYQMHCANSEIVLDLNDDEIDEACVYELSDEDLD